MKRSALWSVLLFVFLGFIAINCSQDGGGGKECKADSDCPSGQYCKDSKCTPRTGEGSSQADGGVKDEPPPVPCKTDLECGAGKLCKNNFCKPVPDKCTKDEECGTALVCNPKTSKCERKSCRLDSDCPDGQSCDRITRKCLPAKPCKKSEDCPKGFVCNTCRNLCTQSLNSGKCSEDYNCPGGALLQWCDKCIGECRPRLKICEPCSKDEECGEEEDLCLPDPKTGEKFCGRKCQSNTFCAPGFVCKKFDPTKYKYPYQCVPASGNCRKPGECNDDADCRPQGKVCDKRTRLCVKGCKDNTSCPVKNLGSCNTDSDCASKHKDAKCVGGQCQIQLACCRGRCGVPCKSDSDCERQERCKGGCCRLEGECQTSKDCPAKHYCDQTQGICKPGCQVADDCGLPDPQKQRCRFKCTKDNKCVEDCSCRNQHIDCPPIRFCPKDQTKPNAPCRKPVGPVCKPCQSDADCGCKPGDDCLYPCTRKQCKSDADCKGLPNGANSCYNGRCSTKKKCRTDKDCPAWEKCENGYCAEKCYNMCMKLQSGNRCFTACDPKAEKDLCPSRLSCIELLPQKAQGPKCQPSDKRCKTSKDCPSKFPRCGEDGYCTSCGKGKVCRNLDQKDPTNFICIDMPPTVCGSLGGDLCADGGF